MIDIINKIYTTHYSADGLDSVHRGVCVDVIYAVLHKKLRMPSAARGDNQQP